MNQDQIIKKDLYCTLVLLLLFIMSVDTALVAHIPKPINEHKPVETQQTWSLQGTLWKCGTSAQFPYIFSIVLTYRQTHEQLFQPIYVVTYSIM